MRLNLFVIFVGFMVVLATPCLSRPDDEWMTEFLKTTTDRIEEHGYPSENHQIQTEDNYLITLYRMPYSHKLQNQNEKRPAVFLQHGFTSSSDNWVLNGPDDGLPFLLVDAGYDVWIGNARGTRYGRNHTYLSPGNPHFWRFSWHEIGVYDMAASIDFILAKTNEKAVHYIGHSQGTTVFFVLMAERPEYNDRIKTAHMLAPVAFMENMSTLLVQLSAGVLGETNKWSRMLEDFEVMSSTMLFVDLYEEVCEPREIMAYVCKNLYFIAHESRHSPNINMTIVDHYNETHPAGASSNQALHYLQEYEHRCFCQYNHGEKKNMEKYGRPTPPTYDVKRINNANMHFYYSDADVMASPKDIDHLVELLPIKPKMNFIDEPIFTHVDFILSMQVRRVINDPIIAACDAYERSQQSK